jgi:hypothetical protein
LEGLRTPHVGLLWNIFRADGYSRLEELGELEPTFEEFEAAAAPKIGVRVQTFDDAPPPPRVWFLNEPQNELIQVQRDRLIVNWRRGAQMERYPRYIRIIERFRRLESLRTFAGSENLGRVVPTQCEITYVNHILSGAGWSQHTEIDRVITMWQNRYSDDYLPLPEDVAFGTRFRMEEPAGRPLGRLHLGDD